MSTPQALAYAREQMVAQQLRAWDVLDNDILGLFRQLPRELFVPAAWRDTAYADLEVPLAHGQHMLAPKLVGRIVQAVGVRTGEQVLEIGTGSGFLSACLALRGGQVHSLECHADLADAARTALRAAAIEGVTVTTADVFALLDTLPRHDVVVLTGSLPQYDVRFESLLNPGGRLFAVVGQGPVMQARLVSRPANGPVTRQTLFETAIDALDNAQRPAPFRF
jgi:protein-L-isoaspartate(D-aspartate) O-methyltransferase